MSYSVQQHNTEPRVDPEVSLACIELSVECTLIMWKRHIWLEKCYHHVVVSQVFISISTLLSLPIFICPHLSPPLPTDDVPSPDMVSCEQLPNENLSIAIGQNIAFPNRVLTDSGSFAQIIVGFPDAVVRVHQNTSKCICWCGLLESLLHVTTTIYLART